MQTGAAGSDNVGCAVGPDDPERGSTLDLPLLATSVRLCAGAMACVAICGDKNSGVPDGKVGRRPTGAVKVKMRRNGYSDARLSEGEEAGADAEVFLFGESGMDEV